MTSDEVWDLLEMIASIDRRKLGLTDRQTWEGLIGDLSFTDASAAVVDYYRERREWIMPSDVRQRVAAMRAERLKFSDDPPPPPELLDNPAAYSEWLRENAKRIADGDPPLRALTGGTP